VVQVSPEPDQLIADLGSYRGLQLDSILPADYLPLYELFVGLDEGAIRWRYRGSTPSYDDFVHTLWHNIYAHFLVRREKSGEVVGYVSAYAPQIRDGYCYISMIGVPSVRGRGSMVFAMALFVETLFRIAPFRKLYAEATESNLRQYARAVKSGLFVAEGCYPEHEWLSGRYEAVHTLALYRRTWAEWRSHYGFQGPFDPAPG
jgi:RimJ/RimL family protein N-acetyltransferase